jgi:hypothetical protein
MATPVMTTTVKFQLGGVGGQPILAVGRETLRHTACACCPIGANCGAIDQVPCCVGHFKAFWMGAEV